MRDLHLLIAFIASTPPCLSIHSSVRPSMYTLHSPVSYSSIVKKNTTTYTLDHEKLSCWTKATRPKPGWHKVNLHNAHGSKWKQTVFVVCQCESKKSPLAVFWQNKSQTVGNFYSIFTHQLYVPFYTRWQIFIQLFPTLTKLCHTKRDHPAIFYISLER